MKKEDIKKYIEKKYKERGLDLKTLNQDVQYELAKPFSRLNKYELHKFIKIMGL